MSVRAETAGTVGHMFGLGCQKREARRRAVDSSPRCVVEHEPTGRFLGAGLALVDREQAVEFASRRQAERFLAVHASEPCYRTVELVAPRRRCAA